MKKTVTVLAAIGGGIDLWFGFLFYEQAIRFCQHIPLLEMFVSLLGR